MLGVISAIILSPVAWNHYFVILLLPMIWLFSVSRDTISRLVILALAAVLWLPRWTVWKLVAPDSVHDGRFRSGRPLDHRDRSGCADLLLFSIIYDCYCVYFLPWLGAQRIWRLPPSQPAALIPDDSGSGLSPRNQGPDCAIMRSARPAR